MKMYHLLMVCLLLTSCATTKITAFRNPEINNVSYSSIAIFAEGMALDSAVYVEKKLCEKIEASLCSLGKDILPPIVGYTTQEISSKLTKIEADSILIIKLTSDSSDSRYVGTHTNTNTYANASTTGNINLYGNNGVFNSNTYANVTSQTTAIPIYSTSRVVYAAITLYDKKSGVVVWGGEIKVEGQGAANIKDSVFINSATSKIATALKENNLIQAIER